MCQTHNGLSLEGTGEACARLKTSTSAEVTDGPHQAKRPPLEEMLTGRQILSLQPGHCSVQPACGCRTPDHRGLVALGGAGGPLRSGV
jgi:hypothetical protein